MLRCFAVALSAVLLSSPAFAQVIYYQPVTYQYDSGPCGTKYYYGGTNPSVHQHAYHGALCKPYYYSSNLHRFDGGSSFGQPSPMYDRSYVYSDCAPHQNLARYGWTATDAQNEAYANTPTYFRKADLLASAVRQPDGSYVVPFHAPTVMVVNGNGYNGNGATTGPSTVPTAKQGQIIIIPKRLLDKKIKDLDPKPLKVAVAK